VNFLKSQICTLGGTIKNLDASRRRT
jgi:hypothetical protein